MQNSKSVRIILSFDKRLLCRRKTRRSSQNENAETFCLFFIIPEHSRFIFLNEDGVPRGGKNN